MALNRQSHIDHNVNKTGEPQNFKHIIHDINNSLMLIGIAVDELERHASKRQPLAKLVPRHERGGSSDASQIIRNHIKQIGVMLQEATHHTPNVNVTPAQSLELLSYKMITAFFELQCQEWSLIAPPQTQISVHLAPFDGVILASRAHMTRLFQNLVRNACEAYHAMADKKDVLCLSLLSHVDAQGLTLELSDNGPGIDKALASQIFVPHFTTKRQAGMPKGLGLSNANALAKVMGGTLTLKDTNAPGSTFVLHLPYILPLR